MHQWTGSSLVHVMARLLFGTKLLPEPMLAHSQLDSWEQISLKIELQFYHFHPRKCIWKCRLTKWWPFCPGGDELIATTVPADGLEHLGARTSAVTEMTWLSSCIFIGPAVKRSKVCHYFIIYTKKIKLERLHSEIPPPPHDYPCKWFTSDPKSKDDKVKVTNLKKLSKIQILKFCKKLYMQHTFGSCLIRCVNMIWIQPEL